MRWLRLVLVCISLLVPSIGRAAPIEYLQDDRSLFYRTLGPGQDDIVYRTPSTPFAPFVGGPDGALVWSIISPNEMNGFVEGRAWVLGPNTYTYSRPVHDITFAISDIQIASLDLTFSGNGPDWIDYEAALYRGSDVVMGSSSFPLDDRRTTDYTVPLDPGVYSLVVALHAPEAPPEPGQQRAGGVIHFDFKVVPVPEPGTGLLVTGGVLGLAGWRRGRYPCD